MGTRNNLSRFFITTHEVTSSNQMQIYTEYVTLTPAEHTSYCAGMVLQTSPRNIKGDSRWTQHVSEGTEGNKKAALVRMINSHH